MDDQTVQITPDQVTATYHDGTLTIQASGREDGIGDIRIEALATAIIPPEFAVVGNRSPAIGMFPYSVDGQFPFDRRLDEVIVSGKGVHVQDSASS